MKTVTSSKLRTLDSSLETLSAPIKEIRTFLFNSWGFPLELVLVNSGMFYVPDSHPTPSASLSGFGVFLWFFSVGLVWFRLRGVARLAPALLLHASCMRNKRRREVDNTSTPSNRIITTIV